MYKILSNILSYLAYLNMECGLNTTVHFSEDKLRCFPEPMLSGILSYNTHNNPYCVMVKRQNWQKCILSQRMVIRKKCEGDSFCGVCHAGVYEYIHQIREAGTVVGFVAVSGYRKLDRPGKTPNLLAWEKNLSQREMPRELCDVLIPPLCRMFELMFTYTMEFGMSDEYNLVVQFMNECHGQVTLDEVCRQFGRSRSYISHMFNEKSGMTIRSYCNALKLEYAKCLLVTTTLPVTEIAMDAGYNDVSYFICLFKGKFDLTPLKYRQLYSCKAVERDMMTKTL